MDAVMKKNVIDCFSLTKKTMIKLFTSEHFDDDDNDKMK